MQSFVANNGGARAVSGRTGGGGTVANGRAARSIAQRLGGFVSDVGRLGLGDALRQAGWGDLVGRPVREILHCVLDRLGGESSTIDDVDARMALSRLQDQYFGDAITAEELEGRMTGTVERIDLLLRDFFGLYLYEVFCRVFFERLVQRHGETRAYSFLNEISDFIKSTLANRATTRDLARVNWNGPEGQELITDIMDTTLTVFGG